MEIKPILKANFVKDWIDMLMAILYQWGYDASNLSDDIIPLSYFNVERRKIELIKREIKQADTFLCPEHLKKPWEELKIKIENGQDISQSLSKKIKDLDFNDPMLNDWGVHHFHLINKPKRIDNILFAFITNSCFYAINFYTHKDWAKDDIIEAMHRNWPQLIANYKIPNISLSSNITEDGRTNARKKHINTFVEVSDGTVYAPIGGGSLCSGHNVYDRIKTNKQKSLLKNLQNRLETYMPTLLSDLEKQGYNVEPEIEAKLVITENEYFAVLPAYSFRIKLK